MAPVPFVDQRPRRRALPRLIPLALAAIMLSTTVSDGTAMLPAPRLFDRDGVYSPDLRGFKKRRGALDRFARDLADPVSADAAAWRSFVATLPATDGSPALLEAVNTAVNGHRSSTTSSRISSPPPPSSTIDRSTPSTNRAGGITRTEVLR